MKRINELCLVLSLSILLYGCAERVSSGKSRERAEITGIIFDSDMGPDYDDGGVITVLHALAARGECKILATTASNRAPYTAPTIEAFNRFFGHAEIQIGVPGVKGPLILNQNHWTDSIASKYLPVLKKNKDYPDAVAL